MATPEKVKILENTRVAPCSNSTKSANEFSLPLTFFDTYWFKFPPVEFLFFYELTESTSTLSYFNSNILPKLKQSLSLVLVHYLPLAGSLRWPSDSSKPIILYTPNDAISLTVAVSNVDNFHILSSNDMHKANELHPLVPQLISSDNKAEIISLQITLFPNQGFSIGTTIKHAVLDGRTASTFLRSWAYLCKQGNIENPSLPPELTPSFDRSVIKDPAGLDILFLNQWLAFHGEYQDASKRNLRISKAIEIVSDDIVRATFEFSREDIKKLREKALSKLDTTGKQLHLSSFVLALAYTATCLVKAKGEGDRLIVIDLGVDCRTRLDPPIPINYFGNCVIYFRSPPTKPRNFMEENGFSFAVDMISDLVKDIKKGVLESVEKRVLQIFIPRLPGFQVIDVTGSPNFDEYRTDFGLGWLKKVEIVSIDTEESIAVSESRDGNGGIEVGLALYKHEMENFASLFFDGLRKNQLSKI